jgi:tellurite resistance-related uncharacterized protein
MERRITGFYCDDDGDWVAEVACGHGQHVRHNPPFQLRAWVLEEQGRKTRLGKTLDCPLCDRCELPEDMQVVGSSPVWDERNGPLELRRSHRVGCGTWGRLTVHEGRLRFTAQTEPPVDVVLETHSTQAIPPELAHDIEPLGAVRFSIEWLVPRTNGGSNPRACERAQESESEEVDRSRTEDQGGDPACWAHLLCPECGCVLDQGPHFGNCRFDPEQETLGSRRGSDSACC